MPQASASALPILLAMVTERAEFPKPPMPPTAIPLELERLAERVLERLREQVSRQRRH